MQFQPMLTPVPVAEILAATICIAIDREYGKVIGYFFIVSSDARRIISARLLQKAVIVERARQSVVNDEFDTWRSSPVQQVNNPV